MPNFIEIARNAAEIWRFFDFLRWRRPPSWILNISKFLTVVTVKKVELHHYAKFHRNRSKRGRDMRVSILCYFGLKMPIHAFLGGFWGIFLPNDVNHHPYPKKDHPWAEPRHLSHKPRVFSNRFLNGHSIGLTLWGPQKWVLGVINMVGINISNLSGV